MCSAQRQQDVKRPCSSSFPDMCMYQALISICLPSLYKKLFLLFSLIFLCFRSFIVAVAVVALSLLFCTVITFTIERLIEINVIAHRSWEIVWASFFALIILFCIFILVVVVSINSDNGVAIVVVAVVVQFQFVCFDWTTRWCRFLLKCTYVRGDYFYRTSLLLHTSLCLFWFGLTFGELQVNFEHVKLRYYLFFCETREYGQTNKNELDLNMNKSEKEGE